MTALSDGRLHVGQGEIHALLGANGCGKSTLCKIVAGAVAPDAGVLRIAGREARMRHPRDAEALGVALFFQELSLVPQLTVSENIFLGREPIKAGGFTDRRAMRAQAQALIARFGAAAKRLTPDTLIAGLSPDLRQIVEILKVLARRPRLMIMDEATAALDADQAQVLFDILRAQKAEGVSTIMISHRLDEVFAVADRITVMRNGATTAELSRAEADRDAVVGRMIGQAGRAAVQATEPRGAIAGPPLLAGTDLAGTGVQGVSFTLAPGEILGLGGLQGQGQSALLQGLFGASPFRSGRVTLSGTPLNLAKPGDAVRAGLAYVSGDRGRDASLAGRSIFENLVAARLVRERRWLVARRALAPQAVASAAELSTKYGHMDDAIGTLSGGNQQKVFIARWLATRPKVLLLDDPTKGIDLSAKADLFALIRRLADQGAGIMLYSSDDAELLEHCDRILVFNAGRIAADLAGDRRDAFHLTRAAYGEAA